VSRRFIDALGEDRCMWTITLRDGSDARCGRRKQNAIGNGDCCTQHAKMAAKFKCEYCGGNDNFPVEHCTDCERPRNASKENSNG